MAARYIPFGVREADTREMEDQRKGCLTVMQCKAALLLNAAKQREQEDAEAAAANAARGFRPDTEANVSEPGHVSESVHPDTGLTTAQAATVTRRVRRASLEAFREAGPRLLYVVASAHSASACVIVVVTVTCVPCEP